MTMQETLDRIEDELTEVMGPLAPVILKEKAAEFGMSIETLSADKVPELVEEASFEIQSHHRKMQFQRAALKILRDLPQEPVVSARQESPREGSAENGPIRRKSRLRLADEPRPQRQEEKVSAENKGGLRLA